MVVQAKEPALLELFIVSNRKVRLAQGRLEQRIALLRHVEAIRMYAAENGRKLPATLDDIKLPLPVDPFTGKPFRYSFEKDTAHLRGTPPAMPARPRQPDPDEEDDESFEYDADNYDPDDPETYPQGLYDDDGPPVVPCRRCGEEMFEDVDLCPNCGTYQSAEEADQKPRFGPGVIVLILALIAALIMTLG